MMLSIRVCASALLLCSLLWASACSETPDTGGPATGDAQRADDGARGDSLPGDAAAGDATSGDSAVGDAASGDSPAGDPGPGDAIGGDPGASTFTVVTFNTGTTDGLLHDLDTSDGYTSAEAEISNDWYGNGLAFVPAVEGATAFFAALKPEIVTFQEIFYSGDCPAIPSQYHPGFVCDSWSPGDPTVAQVILGTDYQIACHLGKPDKCVAVKKSFGSIAGCSTDLCLDGLDESIVSGCGGGSRLGRGRIQLAAGGELNLINVHGNSGVTLSDQQCRVQQIDRIFVNFGDGQPGVGSLPNIVLGDLNTDPGRMTLFDLSAIRWNVFVGDGLPFQWITEVGSNAIATYQGFSIDHVMSDSFSGSCMHPGFTAGVPDVLDFIYFDHAPAVCSLSTP